MTDSHVGLSAANRIGVSSDFDQEIYEGLRKVATFSNLPIDELVEVWPLFIRRIVFAKMAALMEIFGRVKHLPGEIVECGVYRGQSLGLFRLLLEIYCHGDSLKRVIGFDTFQGLTKLEKPDGGKLDEFDRKEGGWDAGQFLPFLESALELAQRDSYLPRLSRVELIKGDVCQTIPEYLKVNPGLRICLLNLDMDIYKPTKFALETLFPRVVPGGIIILDEYAMRGFPGESAALDEFLSDNDLRSITVEKFSFSPTPGAFFVKA